MCVGSGIVPSLVTLGSPPAVADGLVRTLGKTAAGATVGTGSTSLICGKPLPIVFPKLGSCSGYVLDTTLGIGGLWGMTMSLRSIGGPTGIRGKPIPALILAQSPKLKSPMPGMSKSPPITIPPRPPVGKADGPPHPMPGTFMDPFRGNALLPPGGGMVARFLRCCKIRSVTLIHVELHCRVARVVGRWSLALCS